MWWYTKEGNMDREVGKECLHHCVGANWWEWHQGLTLLFWCWPKHLRSRARDGCPGWVQGPLLRWKHPQQAEPNLELWAKIKAKSDNVHKKHYIQAGEVLSLTSYFAVP